MAVFSDFTTNDSAGRHGFSFKDGGFARRGFLRDNRRIEIYDSEGRLLHTNYDLCAGAFNDFVAGSISPQTSSFDGRLILYIDGFVAGSRDSRHVTLRVDYFIQPPTWYQG